MTAFLLLFQHSTFTSSQTCEVTKPNEVRRVPRRIFLPVFKSSSRPVQVQTYAVSIRRYAI